MTSLQYVRIRARTDKEKEEANIRLFTLLHKALLISGSFDYPFDSLVTISRLPTPDKQARVISWNIPESAGKELYFGFLQSYNAKKKNYDLYILKDKSAEITNPQSYTGSADKWMGMVYYSIIQDKGKEKTYILLGRQGAKLINRKIIDVLSINNQGVPSFGKAVFTKLPSTYKTSPKRMIFEYSSQVYMSLRYDESKKMILFDHLGPTEPELEGQHQYYGPSFDIDGLSYKNGMWSFVKNVDARNPEEKGDKLFNDPLKPSYQLNKKPIYETH